jgi:hypothetical protein
MENPQGATETEKLKVAPHGLNEIIATFGDIHEYVGPDGKLDPRWEADFLARVNLPFPLRLAWDLSRTITQMTCHRRMTGIYASVLPAFSRAVCRLESRALAGALPSAPSGLEVNCQPTAGASQLILIRRATCRDRPGTWIPGWLRSFVARDLSGAVTGRARLATLCIFNSAPDIKFLPPRAAFSS